MKRGEHDPLMVAIWLFAGSLLVGLGSYYISRASDCEKRGGELVRGVFGGWSCVQSVKELP